MSKTLPRYGVCDSPAQLVRSYPEYEGRPIWFFPVYRSEQDNFNGWRWHKWGTYVGEHQDTVEELEYLAKSNLNVQYVFSLEMPSHEVGGCRSYRCIVLKAFRDEFMPIPISDNNKKHMTIIEIVASISANDTEYEDNKKVDNISEPYYIMNRVLDNDYFLSEFDSRLKAAMFEPVNMAVETKAKVIYEEDKRIFGSKPTNTTTVTGTMTSTADSIEMIRWRRAAQLSEEMYTQTIFDHRCMLKKRVQKQMLNMINSLTTLSQQMLVCNDCANMTIIITPLTKEKELNKHIGPFGSRYQRDPVARCNQICCLSALMQYYKELLGSFKSHKLPDVNNDISDKIIASDTTFDDDEEISIEEVCIYLSFLYIVKYY